MLEFRCGWVGEVSVLQAEAQDIWNQEQYDQCGNSTAQPQAPNDGYINARYMLSTSEIKYQVT